jgi:LacI family transcriptional regulator
MKPHKNLTINDLAAHLGVHKSTISRAMDPERRHLVSADMLERVSKAAAELGYRQNWAASMLSTGKSKAIGVLLPDITNPVFPPILRGIEDALEPEGYFAILANTSRHPQAVRQAVDRLLSQRVDGFLIASATLADAWLEGLRRTGAQIVLVNRTDGRGQLPAAISDDEHGMALAVQHLVELGHRQILHLAGPETLSTGLARRDGFLSAMAQHQLAPGPILACNAYSIEEGARAMTAYLASGPSEATAIVAANDLLALGALQALKAHGVAVPQQMSVVGHNDMPWLDQLATPLTTIRIQHYEIGFRAARLLLDGLKGTPGSIDSTVMLRPQLIVRSSTSVPGQS